MQVKSNRIGIRGAFALLLLGLPAAAHAQYAYNIVSLPDVGVYGLNNKGQVAVAIPITVLINLQPVQISHAGYYSNGVVYDTEPGSYDSGYGSAISDNGLLAVSKTPAAVVSRPAIYDINTGLSRFLPLYPPTASLNAINAAGDVAVQLGGTSSVYHYSTDQYETLNLPATAPFSIVNAINNKGELAGSLGAFAASYSNSAFHLIGHFPGDTISQANGINDNGDIVGVGDISQSLQHAFLSHNGQLQDLGTLQQDNFHSSIAASINNEGDVVGVSGSLPFLYRNGQMEDLFSMVDPSLGWTDGVAIAINDNGWILGRGNSGGFLMIPNPAVTPEPNALAIMGVGIGLFALRSRRSRFRLRKM